MRYSESQMLTLKDYYNNYDLSINPYDELGMGLTKKKDLSARTYARLNIKLADWINLTTQFQYEAGEYKTNRFREKEMFESRDMFLCYAVPKFDANKTIVWNLPQGNIFKQATNSTRAYNFRSQLDIHKTHSGVHDITALFGFEMRQNKINYSDNTLYNYDPDLLTHTMVDAAALKNVGGYWRRGTWSDTDIAKVYELTNRYVSIYGNIAYTFDDRYSITGSLRWDRTNLFATSSKYQDKPIWSVGAAWRIDKEKFFNVDKINMLKLRASYGIGGNIAKTAAPYLTVKYQSNNNVGGTQGSILSRPNPDLRWEKTTTTNIGIDFAAFNNRLNGSFEYYFKKGTDLLCQTNGVAWEGFGTGITNCVINNGRMDNRGFEISLRGTIYADRDWSWSVNGVLGYNKNEVKHVNITAPTLQNLIANPTGYPRVGVPLQSIYAYHWAGLDENGIPCIYDKSGELVKRKNMNDPEEVYSAGSLVPICSGSIGTNLRFRDFEFSAMMLYACGHKMRNGLIPYMSGGVYWGTAGMANRWQKPGDENTTNVPRYLPWEHTDYNQYDGDFYEYADINVLDASNWRLRNISLSYSIPRPICRKAYMSNVRVMIGMENVLTIAKSKEAKYLLGGYNRPNYTFGINVNF